MRSSVLILSLFVLLAGCVKESPTKLTNANTFIRYFNGGVDDIAVSVQETSDGGYIILANSAIKPNDVTGEHYKVKLIKTNAFGTLEWEKVYPEYENDTYTINGTILRKSYYGNGLLILPDNAGYVVVGEDIKQGIPQLFMMATDNQGENFREISIPGNNIRGRAVARNSNGNLLVLAQSTNEMILREYSLTPFNPLANWSRTYEAGTLNNLVNKIFTNTLGNVYWGGTVTKLNSTTKIRFIKTTQNSDLVDSDPVIGDPIFNETGADICRYGFGYAVIGRTDKKQETNAAGDFDILFRRLAEDGSEVIGQSKSFPLPGIQQDGSQTTDLQGNEEGNSIFASADGGLILLGTVDSQVGAGSAADSRGNTGRGEKDLYLIKIDPFGNVAWTQIYGSKFEDVGTSVIQSSDGGYVVLGTANISNTTRTVMLLKTDKEGRIE